MTPGRDPRTHQGTRRKNLILMGGLFGLVFGMIGLSFAAVPLYDLFCKVTGFGGTTQRAEGPAGEILDRTVKVRFNADVNGALPWGFRPEIHQMEVRIGESAMMSYRAVNNSDEPIVGTATYNVTPDKTGIYFNKIQCFCFTEQRLEPGQSVDMPVYFFVDPAMADDPKLDDVQTITLSYTFFRAHGGGAAGQVTSINE
ncbi:cytochrome c oxidase assembly protein [Skermanella sp. TT6]|uniref:Cytochrome c oxidase assembly protein CtaG n=1 Tax=Skermanella cutis TaxID=2775420 RepID=A0ABX7B6S6_9PROT|nr:cytochrome c oxidase assembly protein [Skermanella sp. TT6]QQP90073.1 cytochrome c oxidase assembly protein [Skermanella sp. TT6]